MTATAAAKPIGRPKAPNSDRVSIEESRVYKFLQDRLPERFRVRGRLNIGVLAKATDMSTQGIYHWFGKDRISPIAAGKIVEVSDGNLTMADLLPFFANPTSK